MANSVEDALARASAEQREKAEQVIADARSSIQMATAQGSDISSSSASSIVSNAQIIEDAKRSMPSEVQSTMQSVDAIASPMPTPSPAQEYDTTPIELNPDTANKIESIQQGGGNNYMYPSENAVDRAISRPSQDMSNDQPEQQELGR